MRFFAILTVVGLALAGCATTTGPDGQTRVVKNYRVSKAQESRIQYRMLDSVNALRRAGGLTPLELNANLNAAAATHARDMAVQNRPWHFGSDGSSPIDRVARVGYKGTLKGEAISETFETELETLAAWMDDKGPRDVLMDPDAREMGFSFTQEADGKIWWTLVTGAPAAGDAS
jgi:uncharacterized protein YkwD